MKFTLMQPRRCNGRRDGEMRKQNLFIGILVVALAGAGTCSASDLGSAYLKQLKSVHEVTGNGDNELFILMSDTSAELDRSWDPQLAKELARVFNELLNVNQNYFLVELLDPVAKTRPEQFGPILDNALSDENKVLYRQSVEMDKREDREGNGP